MQALVLSVAAFRYFKHLSLRNGLVPDLCLAIPQTNALMLNSHGIDIKEY